MKASLQLYSNNFGLKQLSITAMYIRNFITKELEYKAVLKFKNNLYVLLCIS